MKNVNDYIVYRKQVCKIIGINEGKYELVPVSDEDIKMQVPVDSKVLRDLISKEKIDKILLEIPGIDVISSSNEARLENEYKELMSSGTHEDLIKIIKTTYLRNEIRKNNNKKISDKDNEYFLRAEKYLYEELSVVLGLDYEATKEYVINMVSKLER